MALLKPLKHPRTATASACQSSDISEAVTEEKPVGEQCFSLLLLNRKLKADKGGSKSPWWLPSRRDTSAAGHAKAELDAIFFHTTAPKQLFSADTSLDTSLDTSRQKGDGIREGVHVLVPHHPVWCKGEAARSLQVTHACALQVFIVISYALILSSINVKLKLLVLVFHKYCSGELAEFNYSYHEIVSINQMPVAAVFCSFESKKLFKNYFIKSRKLF